MLCQTGSSKAVAEQEKINEQKRVMLGPKHEEGETTCKKKIKNDL